MQMYDPKTKEVTPVDTCFGTHHLNFDDNDVLWFTGGGAVEGWFDTRIYDKTKDEAKALRKRDDRPCYDLATGAPATTDPAATTTTDPTADTAAVTETTTAIPADTGGTGGAG